MARPGQRSVRPWEIGQARPVSECTADCRKHVLAPFYKGHRHRQGLYRGLAPRSLEVTFPRIFCRKGGGANRSAGVLRAKKGSVSAPTAHRGVAPERAGGNHVLQG